MNHRPSCWTSAILVSAIELALVKSLLLLGVVLLVGGGVTALVIAPELTLSDEALRRRLAWGGRAGAALLLVGSAFDIFLTLFTVLGRPPPLELAYRYLTTTRHGAATLCRAVLVAVVLGLTLRLCRRAAIRQGRALNPLMGGFYFGLSLFLLGTFSYTSHAAATGGALPLLADLVHFAAAAVWAGPLFYLALVPDWRGLAAAGVYTAGLHAAFKRVSSAGLSSVLALFVTGGYTALIHLQDPARFATSPYGYALYLKLFLVLLIVGLAGLNRFWLLPAFLRRGAFQFRRVRFIRVVRLEGALLILVFLATGLLSTSALPHGEVYTGAWSNLVNLVQALTGD